jgi:hypothetical protein
MSKINSSRQNRIKFAIYLMLSVGFISAMAMSLKNKKEITLASTGERPSLINAVEKNNDPPETKKRLEAESKEAFIAAYKVFMHPRCMNCHPAGDVPLQGDDSHLHAQGVKRGKDGKGLYALKCSNCHQAANTPGEDMPPGNPNWHLPPANMKMVFQGKTPAQLAAQFKDPKLTGKTLKELLHHVEEDNLVLGCWNPGDGRTKPPLNHDEFAAKVKEWIEKGAAIPDK